MNHMHLETGQIYPPLTDEQRESLRKQLGGDFIAPMNVPPTPKQLRRATPVFPHGRIGRNDKCPCGSGRKFKKCCMK